MDMQKFYEAVAKFEAEKEVEAAAARMRQLEADMEAVAEFNKIFDGLLQMSEPPSVAVANGYRLSVEFYEYKQMHIKISQPHDFSGWENDLRQRYGDDWETTLPDNDYIHPLVFDTSVGMVLDYEFSQRDAVMKLNHLIKRFNEDFAENNIANQNALRRLFPAPVVKPRIKTMFYVVRPTETDKAAAELDNLLYLDWRIISSTPVSDGVLIHLQHDDYIPF